MHQLNRAGLLTKDLQGYCFKNHEFIETLSSDAGYMCVVAKTPIVKKYHEKLLSLNASIKNGVTYNIAVDSVFAQKDIEYFDSPTTLDVDQCLKDLKSVTEYDEPIEHLLRVQSSIDFAYKSLVGGDISRLEFAQILSSKNIEKNANKVIEAVSKLNPLTIEDIVSKKCVRCRATPRKPPIVTSCLSLNKALEHLPSVGFIVLAARTNVGKTYFATYHSYYAAKATKVLYISLEMDAESIVDRMLCIHHSITTKSLNTIYDNEGLKSVEYLQSKGGEVSTKILSDYSLCSGKQFTNMTIIDLQGDGYVSTILSIIEKYAKEGYEEFVVDYIQNVVRPSGDFNEGLVVAELCTKLRETASKHSIRIIGCSQINRVGSSDEKPQLTHMKSSSVIENSADAVVVLHRHRSSLRTTQPTKYTLNYSEYAYNIGLQHMVLTIEKNRSGESGVEQEFGFASKFAAFIDIGGWAYKKARDCFSINKDFEDEYEGDDSFS